VSVGTVFYPRESALNAHLAWGEWSGYHSAAVYADFHDIEYNAIREAAGVVDVSPLYKYIVRGSDAGRLLDRVMTRDISRLKVDHVAYTPWCDEDGKVIDDGTITRLSEDSYRITAADPCERWFRMNATGLDVEVEDISDRTAGLALQGRLSREVLEEASGQDWSDVRYFRRRRTQIADVDVDVTRTGYTGDRGFELWMPVDGALAVWDRVFDVGQRYGIQPVGIRAMDVARVEAGLILIEVEYSSSHRAIAQEQHYSPYELGLGRLVDLRKASPFNGKRALLAEQAAGGPARRLVGLELEWAGIEGLFAKHDLAPAVSPMVHRDPVPVYKEGKQIGRATSITWGPTIKKMVGFGSVDKRHERPGTRLSVEWSVEGERGKVAATVVSMPFLDLERKRS
jgi:glycine cleavage system T protein (aminomethyltransferase)